MLQDMGMEKISHIDSGFNGWKDAGLPIVDYETWKAQ
jgi:3-mercaptopyruvate sulfurtransferase SseA